MGKLLTWVAIAGIAWLIWRFVVLSKRRADNARGAADRGGAPDGGGADAASGERPERAPGTPELMMQCAVCGVHLPGSEARFARGRVYCSDAHRDQDAAGAPAAEPVSRDRR